MRSSNGYLVGSSDRKTAINKMGTTYIYAENYHDYACEPAKTPVCIMKVTFWDQVTSSFCPDWGFWSFAAVVKALGFGCYNPTVLEVVEFSIVVVHTILHTASSCIMLYCILLYHIPVWTNGSMNFGGGLWSNFLVCLFRLHGSTYPCLMSLPMSISHMEPFWFSSVPS